MIAPACTLPLAFVSGNEHKAREVEAILGFPIERVALDVPEIQHTDPRVVAEDKARRAFAAIRRPLFVDDTSFEIEQWGGFPGSLVKWLVTSVDLETVCRMADLTSARRVSVRVVIAYHDGEQVLIFEGVVRGTIAPHPRGDTGFCFDQIFIPEGGEQTYAELPPGRKNEISHRKRALDAFREFLAERRGAR